MSWLGSWLGGGGGAGGDTEIGSQTPYFRLAGTQQHGLGALTVPWPDHDVNDIALLLIENQDAGAPSLSTAAGFVQVTNSPQLTSLASRLSVYWCRATSSAMASPVIADPGDHCIAQILVFRGVKTTGNPWNVTAGSTIGNGSSSLMTLPTATTTVDNCLVVLAGTTNADGGSLAWASGWANSTLLDVHEVTDIRTDDGGGGGIVAAVGVMEAAGVIGTSTFSSTANSQGGGMTIALLPEPPPVIPMADVIPPTITNISPVTNIRRDTIIEFDVTDETSLALVAIFASWTINGQDVVDMIHDGQNFRGNYTSFTNTRVHTSSAAYHFRVRRNDGWPVDKDGNVVQVNIEWLVLDGGANMAVIA